VAYLDITLETDKWYISEGFMSMPAPATPEEAELMIRHNQNPESMVLGGPFYTSQFFRKEQREWGKHKRWLRWGKIGASGVMIHGKKA